MSVLKNNINPARFQKPCRYFYNYIPSLKRLLYVLRNFVGCTPNLYCKKTYSLIKFTFNQEFVSYFLALTVALDCIILKEKMIIAEVWFAINFEMACTPTDFFMRRTGRLLFDPHSVILYHNLVLEEFKKAFSLDDKIVKKHQKELAKQLKEVSTFE